jgi:hypothetical protein
MSIGTNLRGRLRNTPLPRSHGLLPLFEAVVNSIHAIEELNAGDGEIEVEIIRESLLDLDDKARRGVVPLGNILGFKVFDNGVGFHDQNMKSFETLDTEYKSQYGCRGVGRLLWLKAFSHVNVVSTYLSSDGVMMRREFAFSPVGGVSVPVISTMPQGSERKTIVHLDGFNGIYREKSPKTARTIAASLLEHCLWYFVRDGGAPVIWIKDGAERISLDDIYREYMFSSALKERIEVKGNIFELTHIKLRASAGKQHLIAWCAAGRVVDEEILSGKIPGLHGKIESNGEDFVYACYVASAYLDEHVRPERIGFDISDDLFSQLNFDEIRTEVLSASARYLEGHLQEIKAAAKARVESFVAHKAPRYRPILFRISEEKLSIDPMISDKDLDLLLHKHLSEIESQLLVEGHEIAVYRADEDSTQYRNRLHSYLEKASDIKRSDLADYVFHRKVIIDILEQAIKRGPDGKYAREELIHELIMPMRLTSNEVRFDDCNLWLVDERLAFHDFLASDKTLSSMPITGSNDGKEPDLCALNVFDQPVLVSDDDRLPLASIVIVEIKRPMRNDAAPGEERDPVEQALGYLERIRAGGAKTASGRQIPKSDDIPGYCYAICDLTPSVVRRCKMLGLTVTADHLGYFGYNQNFKAYVEVISFDRLLNSARERNRAFFDKLGLPA